MWCWKYRIIKKIRLIIDIYVRSYGYDNLLMFFCFLLKWVWNFYCMSLCVYDNFF